MSCAASVCLISQLLKAAMSKKLPVRLLSIIASTTTILRNIVLVVFALTKH